MTGDTASSPDRKKAKLDPFADVRDYTAPSTGALHATSAAELAEYMSMSAPAVGPLEFWQRRTSCRLCPSSPGVFCVCLRARPNPSVTSSGRTVTEMRSRMSAEKVEALELVRSGMRLGVVWQWHVSVCRLYSRDFELWLYVSCVLRPRLVANVNSSVSSCGKHWKSNDKVLQWFHIVFARIQQHNALHFYTAGSGRVGSRVRRRCVGLGAGPKKWPVSISEPPNY